ncbi:Proton glutamate symport protein [Candidatus Portiera aleyrodidarum]|uniref:Na+/H+ dicarboxylate symporter n=1 Tax=Candidatus Portiera aleyrodidarum TV TaxID=1297582 RepID=A0A8D4BNA1_9GAMM|nr:cation:dicarboxylase symporter family transporter [Candidatus Portiera aleyrodidarum]AGI27197.1 Na+/H+ dicarboxylate symporter [Candidatus Portiera aleyrodidarum TV]CEI59182.1 Proton glutamate symport protein [Candidatus Portiera aleyrodidarum]
MKIIQSKNLALNIIIGLFLGIITGLILHQNNIINSWVILHFLQPCGEIFIRLIKMIVIPIIISSLIIGISGIEDTKKLSRIGLKTILYFEIVTTLAIIVGLIAANIFQPGYGINMSKLSNNIDISQYKNITNIAQGASHTNIINIIVNLIPSNIFKSFVKGDILSIIFFSVLFSLGLSGIHINNKQNLITIIKTISETMFNITNIIMRYSPIGVYSLISITVANFGFLSLIPLIKLVFLVYFTIIFFIFIILGSIAWYFGFNIIILLRIIKNELLLAFTTSSSETVLLKLMSKMENYGAPKNICNFVIPTGYSFNLDGSTLYQSIAALFIAQLYGINLTLFTQITLILTLMITSKGIAGIPGVSFVVLLATLGSIGIPIEGIAFIAGVDRILDMARTVLNVIGNALAVLIISKWENQYDTNKGLHYFKSKKYKVQ